MSPRKAPAKIGQSLEALEEFVDAATHAQEAIQHLGSLLFEEVDR